MAIEHQNGVQSSVNIGGHPIHPMLIPLPAAAFIFQLFTDLAWLQTDNAFWAQASWYLLVAGLATGVLAGLVGAVDYFTIQRVRQLASGRVHAIGNVVALALAAGNLASRADDVRDIAGTGLILTLATMALLSVTAWLGGELSYRHRIGVAAPEGERRRA
jgi:uncharacterized membrane protein